VLAQIWVPCWNPIDTFLASFFVGDVDIEGCS